MDAVSIYIWNLNSFVCSKWLTFFVQFVNRETSMLRQQKSALVEISKFVIWYVRYTIPTVFVGQ